MLLGYYGVFGPYKLVFFKLSIMDQESPTSESLGTIVKMLIPRPRPQRLLTQMAFETQGSKSRFFVLQIYIPKGSAPPF